MKKIIFGLCVLAVGHMAASATEDLWKAVEAKDFAAVKRALADGADVNAQRNGWSVYLEAAMMPNNKRIENLLLLYGADTGSSKETILMKAAKEGSSQLLEKMIKEGADVNAQERLGKKTALRWAIERNYDVIAQLLLAAGAKIPNDLNEKEIDWLDKLSKK